MTFFPSILFILLYLLCLRRVCFINICIKQSSRGKNSRKTRLKINDSSSLQFSNQKLSDAWFNLTYYHSITHVDFEVVNTMARKCKINGETPT